MRKSPKNIVEKLEMIIEGWSKLAPEKTFGGMTLEEFKVQVKSSFDARDRISDLEDQLKAEQTSRDIADKETMAKAQLVVNGIIGDPEEGPNSDLYEAIGYVRKDDRKSGLTRKKKTPATI